MANSMTWLIVGGAPRSGTTALGAAINQAASVALLHEYDSRTFFDAIEHFFGEEDRLMALQGSEVFRHLIPNRQIHGKAIAQSLFRDIFNKDATIIDTKFPGYQAWPAPRYPSWITPRVIHITRNPYDVVLSMIKKDDGNQCATAAAIEDAIHQWLSAWNHAIAHADDSDFCHVLYDDLIQAPEQSRRHIADFLGVDDFSLDSFKDVHSRSIADRYAAAGLEPALPLIGTVAPMDDWLGFAREAFAARQRLGFPLLSGEAVPLFAAGRKAHLYAAGFYPPERDGIWTKGERSDLLFSLNETPTGPVTLTLEFLWSATLAGEPRELELVLNGETIYRQSMFFGERNGQSHHFVIRLPEMPAPAGPGSSHCLQLMIANPINPGRAGINSDDRDIGLMLRSFAIAACPPAGADA